METKNMAEKKEMVKEGVLSLAGMNNSQRWAKVKEIMDTLELNPYTRDEILKRVPESIQKYSMRNQILIMLQKPMASKVAGMGAWNKEDMKVKKGEKAIWIIIPYTRKAKKQVKEEEDPETCTGFGFNTVFDVSQVEKKD